MTANHEANIASHETRLSQLVAAPSLQYRDWPPVDS